MYKVLKWVKILVISLFILLLIFFILLQTPFAKRLIRGKLEAYLSTKTGGQFRIQNIDYNLLKWVEADGITVRDMQGDTLLSGERLRVGINIFKLLTGRYEINQVELDKMNVAIIRKKGDSTFNYQFLIDAFASKSLTPKKDTTPFILVLNEIHIQHSKISWIDPYNGTVLHTQIGQMDVVFDNIDIARNRFLIQKLDMANVLFDMKVLPFVAQKANGIPYALPFIRLGKSHIAQTHVVYEDENSGINTNDIISDLRLENASLQTSGSITADKIFLSNSVVTVNRRSFDNAKIRIDTSINAIISDSLGVFHIKELRLSEDNIVLNDIARPFRTNGLDMHHINFQKIAAKAANIDYTGKIINASFASLSGREKSGFTVDSLRGDVLMTDSLVTIKGFSIKTPYSYINGSSKVYPFAFSENSKSNVQNSLQFRNNVISRKDLQLLAPDWVQKYHTQMAGISTIYIDAEVDGNVRKANIHRLKLMSDKKDMYIDASGTIVNALSKKSIQFDVIFHQLNITRNVLLGFMDAKTKQQISLPPAMNIKGRVKGDMIEIDNDLTVNSAFGSATVKGRLRNFTKPDQLGYALKIYAKNLETGKWVNKDSLFGKVTGSISAKGSGIDYKTATIESVVDLSSFRVQKHAYTGISLKLNGKTGSYNFDANTNDPLLMVSLHGNASLNKKYPSGQGKVIVLNANLFALGLYADTLAFKTKAVVDLKDLDPSSLNAMVQLDSIVIYKERSILKSDSFLARGYMDSGKTILSMRSSPADATFKGQYRYTELGSILQQYIGRYTNAVKTGEGPPPNAYDISMSVDVKPDPLYAVLIPGLFFNKNMSLRGKMDNKQRDSSGYFSLSVPGVVYKSEHVVGIEANFMAMADSMKFNIKADTVQASSLNLYTTNLQGGFTKDKLSASFATNDKNEKEKYAFAINGNRLNGLYQIHLKDRLKLNYENWQVNDNNTISMGTGGFNVNQFTINKGKEVVSINSNGREQDAPLDVKIDHFALRNITGLMNADSLSLDGRLDATVTIADLNKGIPSLNGIAKIDSLQYQHVSLGILKVEAMNTNESVTLTGSLTGNGNNVDLKGNYDQQMVNAQINLNPVMLKTIEPFTQGNLSHATGSLSGPINITGTLKNPEWNGVIHFDSTVAQLTNFGTVMHMGGQQIELKYPAVNFTHFTIKDSVGHDFIIDGSFTENDKQLFNANFTLKAKDFTALNNNSVTNGQLYGKAMIDADMSVSGPISAPDISGSLALKDKSEITFVREQYVATAKDRESIMQFVDMDTVKNELLIPPANNLQNKADYGALNYNLNIDISKDAQFNIIVDPLTRDVLQIKGAAQLNAGVSPDGSLSITGAYNLTKGSYVMNYQFIKRKFELQEGSTLVFSGDPLNAQADITAIYSIEASPYDLVGNEISDNNSADTKLYKQKVPFEVLLKIKGEISAPQLQFDVRLKENTAGISYNFSNTIDNKLLQLRSDVASMNKQVFGLLVMGRFIGEQSTDFFGSIGGSNGIQADQLVKASVSRFLSDAVNQVASDLIKGVDINVNLQTAENYSTATQRTDLNLALSKRFLNDRLNVTVGKSFTVAGEDPSAKGDNAQFMPDITTTYKLSKDGRYMLKAYQRNQYEAVLDGYFIETGVAFTLTMDYNKFAELIHKNKTK